MIDNDMLMMIVYLDCTSKEISRLILSYIRLFNVLLSLHIHIPRYMLFISIQPPPPPPTFEGNRPLTIFPSKLIWSASCGINALKRSWW